MDKNNPRNNFLTKKKTRVPFSKFIYNMFYPYAPANLQKVLEFRNFYENES